MQNILSDYTQSYKAKVEIILKMLETKQLSRS